MSTEIKALTSAINRQFGKGTVGTLNSDPASEAEATPSLSTGSIGLDAATGIGGYPVGRVIEIYGPEHGGKSTLVLHAILSAQRAGYVCALLDMDHTFDPAYGSAIGVENGKLLVSQPDTAEQAFDVAEMLVRSGAVGLLVVDSVHGLVPRASVEGEVAPDGYQARLMSQALRKLTAIAHRTSTTILFVNRLREKTATVFTGEGRDRR